MPRYPKVKIPTVKTGNDSVDSVLRDFANSVPDVDEVLGHVFLDDIQLTSGVTSQIPHKLGRKLKGWVVIRINTTGVTIKDLQLTNPHPEKTLWLQPAGGSPKVSLMVF